MAAAPANAVRGEISATLGGTDYTLCLTLGALAELEAAFDADDMAALAARFDQGRLSANDAITIIGAGLRGAGHDVDTDTIAKLTHPSGAAGYIDIVARLLTATFTPIDAEA